MATTTAYLCSAFILQASPCRCPCTYCLHFSRFLSERDAFQGVKHGHRDELRPDAEGETASATMLLSHFSDVAFNMQPGAAAVMQFIAGSGNPVILTIQQSPLTGR